MPTQEVSIPATGKVEHIEVTGNTIMWSVDEPLNADQPDLTVGMVYLFNPADMTSLPLKVRGYVGQLVEFSVCNRDLKIYLTPIRSAPYGALPLQFRKE